MFGNLSFNARMWIAALATAVVASGIGAVVAIVSPSGDDNGTTQAIVSPTPLLEATELPEATEPVASPLPDGSPSPEPLVSPSPTAGVSTTAAPPTAGNRDPRTINCSREPKFCSNVTGAMTIRDGRLASRRDIPSGTNYSGVPESRMTSTVLKPNQQPASQGDQVGWIKVRVDVVNNTNRTYVFPQRRVALVVTHEGDDDVNQTDGPYTEVPPGGALHADFLSPHVDDGPYTWRSKVWFYAK